MKQKENELNEEWLDLVEYAMGSGRTKTEFQQFLKNKEKSMGSTEWKNKTKKQKQYKNNVVLFPTDKYYI
ncbi:anti-repressor SinI family protein [Halobacillus yeomjeoni]|uniref:anti-repressor SinI family protein n=1 Tax=Halobacillus yeomjeoni TaxID=311194 RepID=UPI001CD2824D|nr:anti-repressor SinI family protein [Halobacillus yeomjeoni]MCA0982931.1 anti-repressor SinI family protein [Halobacillus yeomjeoni]